MLTTFYPPFSFGGDGIDVQRTARALVARGHEVTVVHEVNAYEWLAGKHLPPQPVNQDGVEVIALRSRFGVLSPLLTHQLGWPVAHGRTIERLMAERQFDVVVFHNVSLVGGPGLLAFGGPALKVYVAHEHWLVCPTHVLWRFNREPCDRRECIRCAISYGRPPQIWRYTGALERGLAEVDLFIARSEFSRRKHREFGFTPPMSVLPYFMPGTMPADREHPSSARPHARPYFLAVGRLTKMKGFHTVIPAFARYPDADLVIVGDGDEEMSLRALAKDLPNVVFTGRIANDQLAPYYEHAIAALAPSIGYETFGIVLLEAFRRATPVIAQAQGSFPEILEQSGGGLLFSSEHEMLSMMARLQHDVDERQRLGQQGYRACAERWSEDVVIGRFLELVENARRP